MKKIDIKAGEMTFGQKLELMSIFSNPHTSEIEKLKLIIKCLHDKTIKLNMLNAKFYTEYINEIVIGIKFWVDQETTKLNYEPSAEELQAGYNELSKSIGAFGTVKALAKAYSQDPDTILEWKYGKVFGLLLTDFEEHKFSKKIEEIYKKKYGRV